MLWSLCLHSCASMMATSHTLFVHAGRQSPWHQRRITKQLRQVSVVDGARPPHRVKVKIDHMLPTLHISLDGEVCVVGFNHALLGDVLDAVDASAAYVFTSQIAWLMLSCVNMEDLLHNSAIPSFVERSTVSIKTCWKLGTNKRVPTRELATSLPTLSASSANCPAWQVETLSKIVVVA